MTIFLRALWGPFSPIEWTAGSDYGVDWHFFGIREDNSTGRWGLRYCAPKRKFSVISFPMEEKPALEELRDCFVPRQPMLYAATTTDILRNALPPAELARATALSLARITGRR